MKKYFVAGIGTDVGKTIVSAILTEALEADYWKPVQAGDLAYTDTNKVQQLVSNENSKFHPERHRLKHPMSPHAAAELDGVQITLDDFTLPETSNHLIVEGAGGLMVPLNNQDLILDLVQHLELGVILVSRHYLGSINHTLLTVDVLKNTGIEIKGIVFNGSEHPTTEDAILSQTKLPLLGRVEEHEHITPEVILSYKSKFPTL